MKTQLVLVDDHQIVLDGLRVLFATMPNTEVIGTLNDSRAVLPFLAQHAADILLCDLNMPHLSGIDLVLQLRQPHPLLKVLLLTMTDDAATIREAIRAGVSGYVLKQAGRDKLERAISTVMQGKKFFDEDVINALSILPTNDCCDHDLLARLTDREMDVLRLVAEELSSQQIADKLCVSVPTIETHRRHLFQKLGVKNVVGIVKFAMKHGLVK
jgi:DNA-binding NarL/FixJ family response regulator